ncbi:MAG: hypothetical protein ACYTGG_14635 [Planctomycetota bacterium]|jgi:hypothetical protein
MFPYQMSMYWLNPMYAQKTTPKAKRNFPTSWKCSLVISFSTFPARWRKYIVSARVAKNPQALAAKK